MVEKNKNLTLLITLAVMCILVAALIASIASEAQNKTTLKGVVDEAGSIATARLAGVGSIIAGTNRSVLNPNTGTWRTEESSCSIVITSYGNSTTAWTPTTDYTYTSAGVITVKNTNNVNGTTGNGPNATIVSYSYCASDYVSASWGRSMLNLVPGLIALALLVAVVAGAYLILGKSEEGE